TGLKPLTSYVARAYSGSDYGAEIEFTTQGTEQLPNSDFEQWWLDGKVWNPWAEGGSPFWDTGNKGATTLGTSNTYPSDDTPTGKGRSACLETRFVGIGMIGKLAAGNIFAGSYVRTDGTNGILSFGRPWTIRPTRLRGWMKYHSAPISSTTSGYENLKGEPDTGIIWIALIDTDEPFEIRTNPNNRQLFDPDGPYVVAYGKAEWNTDVTEWSRFEVTLDYKSTSRVPKYVVCTASASVLGDYFTGGNGSVMMIDDFELLFDY
ncbi:MAG: PCMD domain-containing protein, partial [Duncaniella sp.]|nr:PCMD domain-containing protein [Duncaniella sp.]